MEIKSSEGPSIWKAFLSASAPQANLKLSTTSAILASKKARGPQADSLLVPWIRDRILFFMPF